MPNTPNKTRIKGLPDYRRKNDPAPPRSKAKNQTRPRKRKREEVVVEDGAQPLSLKYAVVCRENKKLKATINIQRLTETNRKNALKRKEDQIDQTGLRKNAMSLTYTLSYTAACKENKKLQEENARLKWLNLRHEHAHTKQKKVVDAVKQKMEEMQSIYNTQTEDVDQLSDQVSQIIKKLQEMKTQRQSL